MLSPDALRSLIRAEPFRPFLVVMNSGKKYVVRHPEWVRVGRSWVTFYEADDPASGIFDRFNLVSMMLMEHTEFIELGSTSTVQDAAPAQ